MADEKEKKDGEEQPKEEAKNEVVKAEETKAEEQPKEEKKEEPKPQKQPKEKKERKPINFGKGGLVWSIWNFIEAALLAVLGVLCFVYMAKAQNGETDYSSVVSKVLFIFGIFMIVGGSLRILTNFLPVVATSRYEAERKAAVAAARKLSVDMEHIKAGLSNFKGTNRRFEKKGTFNGVTVIDDYAHHPDEIRATLSSAAHYPHNRVWVVFQPHTYSRTKLLFNEFADALSHADKVVLAKIYAARETDTLGISSADLCEKIKSFGKECVYIDNFEDIEKYLLKNCINGDLLITMGAGDVYKIGEDLLK